MNTRTLAAGIAVSTILWLLAWYGETVGSMVAIWNRSETFAHGYLILPICLWLTWQRRDALRSVEIGPCYGALALLAVVGFSWFFAGLAGVGVVQHYAVVLMIALAVLAVLGVKLTRVLVFPLFFLFFAVPFGEFIEPVLMEHTADFTVAALRLTGLPVYREGQFFSIPSGNWSVVEACSGLRYLIASVTVGVLYAHLTYRSAARRALFIAASIVVPIVANWFRAYMIVMIGHLSGMKYAVGVDHLIYGWVFFGVVMMILFWVGSFWREDVMPTQSAAPAASIVPGPPPSLGPVAGAALAAAVLAAAWPAGAYWLESGREERPPVLGAPQGAGGWTPVARQLPALTPNFAGARATVEQEYAMDAARAAIHLSYYRSQRPGFQLISGGNQLVSSAGMPWKNTYEALSTVTIGAEQMPIVETRLSGASGNLLVWHWYWVDGSSLVNIHWGKLRQALAVLLGHGDDGAFVVLYVPYEGKPDAAREKLRAFTAAMLPSISTSLEDARRSKPVE